MGLANTILSLPFFHSMSIFNSKEPHRIILGTVGGFFTGYVAHDATVWASAQAERSKEYRKRLLAEREKIVKEYEERQNKH